MIKSKYRSRKPDYYLLLIIVAFCYNSVLPFVTAIFNRLPYIKYFGDYIVPMCTGFLIALCLASGKFKKLKYTDLFIILVSIIILLLSYIIYPDNQQYYSGNNLKAIFLEAIPWFILGVNFKSDEETLKVLTIVSYFAVVINILYVFYYLGSRQMDYDSMEWSYKILPHVMLAIRSVFSEESKKKRFLAVAMSLISLLYLLSLGTRGPMLIVMVYAAIFVWLRSSRKTSLRVIMTVLLTAAVSVLLSSGLYLTLLQGIRKNFVNVGLSTRVIDLLVSGEYISHTSGRDLIYETLIDKILERPLVGYGVFGEWPFVGYSAHNILLELCMHYGVIIGLGIAVAYVVTVVRGFYYSNNYCSKEIILIFFIFTVVRSVFGGDYMSYYFCFTLGLALKELRILKRIRRELVNAGKAENMA